ncbi:MAG: transglycosylase domain-containing protein [Candidatus Eisenbacteria bacterium]|uniref:Transglycosylase domain-containing protein n=1 Tax=Eiseniibacteriota bacterium TaxID=2212470 RepID=A0A9D6L5H7_UNCEI|nr:transglycosylase domain-containing protein [Candidatus Eisenbacteria bacterium]
MLVEPTRLTIGSLAFALAGEADARGPRFRLALDADSLTARAWQASLPRTVLGPLADLAIAGWYAWSVRLDLDVARPDSVAFDADVTPHGLTIDRARNRLPIETLDRPFVARIHLPHDRIVERDLSPANPHFLPLDAIDTLLVRALLANEDGGFFRHRGFNLEAVRGAIADDVKAGAFRRGAGTITMQLVRNLYLGHRRTLARKGQEVALAWILEHLTTLTKERMLEIYLNIIEWGPDVHGADEACGYYFGHGAGHVTVDEALFLATVVPAPGKWRYRFDRDGALRPFARAQMHFIGRAMAARGWLAPDLLPDADQLRVAILGPARDALFPPASASRRPGTPGDRVLRTAPSAMDFPPDLGRLALGRGAR